MTPTRIVVGIVVLAAVGYGGAQVMTESSPKYLGDFPSIMAKSSAAPAPITHAPAGPSVPDPPHYAADPVVPEQPAPAPPNPAGPGAVGPSVPVGGGGTNGPSNAQPGVGGPLSGGLLPTDLLGQLVKNLPPLDLSKYCVAAGKVVALVPCDQIPKLPPIPPVPPVTGP